MDELEISHAVDDESTDVIVAIDEVEGPKKVGRDRTARIQIRKRKFERLRFMCRQFGDLSMREYVDGVIYHYQN